MFSKLISKHPAKILFVLFYLIHCQNTFQKNAGVLLLKGRKQFNLAFEQLESPLGVAPLNINSYSDEIVKKNPRSWHEFFLFDKFVSLIILSVEPRYFLKIESENFYYHLRREYLQIKEGKTYDNKVKSSNPFLKKVGSHRVEIYFTPTELKYNRACRIAQTNQLPPKPDVWRLETAAKKSVFYTPNFNEQQILRDFTDSAAKNMGNDRKRVIYTNNNIGPASDLIRTSNLLFNFSFIWGKELELTSEVLDGRNKNFENIYELTRDFIAFSSLSSFGNPRNNLTKSGNCSSKSGGSLNWNDSVFVLIRGNLKLLEKFLMQEGFSFEL